MIHFNFHLYYFTRVTIYFILYLAISLDHQLGSAFVQSLSPLDCSPSMYAKPVANTYVCMYVCMYVCICMYVYMYVCMYVCTYVHMYACMYTNCLVQSSIIPYMLQTRTMRIYIHTDLCMCINYIPMTSTTTQQ